MSEKTYIQKIWVIAPSEGAAFRMVKDSPKSVYRDHGAALRDFAKVTDKTTFDGWSTGKRWKLIELTFAVTFNTLEGGG